MHVIRFRHRGDFSKTEKFFGRMTGKTYIKGLAKYGQEGVELLRVSTPKDSGETANSWIYKIEYEADKTIIAWENTNVVKGVNIAIILQYGHGTGTGGYVQGRDYINPAMQPIFDKIAEEAWKEVTS